MLGNPLFASVKDLERRHTRPLAMAGEPKILLEGSKQKFRTDGFTKVDYDSIIDVDNEHEPRI